MAVDVLDTGHDALPKLVLRGHADVAQYRSGELGEEALDEVEPGAVGVNVNLKRPGGRVASQVLVSLEMCAE